MLTESKKNCPSSAGRGDPGQGDRPVSIALSCLNLRELQDPRLEWQKVLHEAATALSNFITLPLQQVQTSEILDAVTGSLRCIDEMTEIIRAWPAVAQNSDSQHALQQLVNEAELLCRSAQRFLVTFSTFRQFISDGAVLNFLDWNVARLYAHDLAVDIGKLQKGSTPNKTPGEAY